MSDFQTNMFRVALACVAAIVAISTLTTFWKPDPAITNKAMDTLGEALIGVLMGKAANALQKP